MYVINNWYGSTQPMVYMVDAIRHAWLDGYEQCVMSFIGVGVHTKSYGIFIIAMDLYDSICLLLYAAVDILKVMYGPEDVCVV